MAEEKKRKSIPPITDDDITALEGVLSNLKSGAKTANDKGNLTTFRVYQRLVKMVSPEVLKANARKERQDQARMEKDAQALKAAQEKGDTNNP